MKIFILSLTEAGHKHVSDEAILFDNLAIKSQTMDDARLIAASFNNDSDVYIKAWTDKTLSKCVNISFFGSDNSVILYDSV